MMAFRLVQTCLKTSLLSRSPDGLVACPPVRVSCTHLETFLVRSFIIHAVGSDAVRFFVQTLEKMNVPILTFFFIFTIKQAKSFIVQSHQFFLYSYI